jgi:ABC-type microcin C transport system duplicated ATPase subunit YejF
MTPCQGRRDPFSSLNPRIKVGKIVGEPLKVHHVGTHQERKSGSRNCSNGSVRGRNR